LPPLVELCYEHVFAPRLTSVADRLRSAAALIRAFALPDDPAAAPLPQAADAQRAAVGGQACAPLPPLPDLSSDDVRAPHPHRVTLAGGSLPRRPGAVPARATPCLSPVGGHVTTRMGLLTRAVADASQTASPPAAGGPAQPTAICAQGADSGLGSGTD
jgi:hypothetical protein